MSSSRVALAVLLALPLAACSTGGHRSDELSDAGASLATPAAPAPTDGTADPHALGPVHNVDEARARWNPTNDPSMVITDNGDDTYKVVRTDR